MISYYYNRLENSDILVAGNAVEVLHDRSVGSLDVEGKNPESPVVRMKRLAVTRT